MKKILFICTIMLFAIGTLSAQKKAVISTAIARHDFGEIKEADGKVSHTFIIKNEGNMPLVLTRVIASCGCTTSEWPKAPLAPGKTAPVKITYDPKGRPGPFVKTISIYSNGKSGSFILTIRGQVI
ncbi:MAG: DUF1573 domain-containing protein [Massilibacteroides sp.]|nr:DUF1573 domain-containing protein [Massilibacteroides sp.]